MVEYPDSKTAGRRPQGATASRKAGDVLTDRLLQMRQRAEHTERQLDEVTAQNRELREQVNALHRELERRAEVAARADRDEAEALRQELMQVRAQAADSRHDAAAPNVELEAELQAARQEAAMLRQAVKEKDKQLEETTAQFRSLEDTLEDREREMDRLHHELAHSRGDSTLSDDFSVDVLRVDSIGGDSGPRHAFQERNTSEILDGASLVSTSSSRWAHRRVLLAATSGLLIGVLGVTAVFLLSDENKASLGAHAVAPQSQRSAETPQLPRTKREFEPAAAVESKIAESEVESAPGASLAVVAQDPLRNGSQGPLLVAVSGGAFVMGNRRGPLSQEEQPAHRVELKPFFMGKYEVTFAQYDLFARATGRRLPDDSDWGRGDRPVIGVSWDDSLAYTRWLSEQTGKNYRLPTEAEWEYAARGGSASRYWWGVNPGNGSAVCFDCGSKWDSRSTAPVGSLAANPYGLHDTAGNVMEWVADCYNPNYKGAPENGSAWVNGDCSQRMVRGGAFNKPSSSLRSAARYQLPRDARFNMLGFRVVRE